MVTRARIRHVPALDGVRGAAVAAVVAFHFHEPALPGGFLGVDLFFVMSGFLITLLLMRESAASGGRVDLKAFWGRRARRLLPAVLLLVPVVLVVSWRLNGVSRNTVGDGLASTLYSANWLFIFRSDSYFDLFADASPFQHMWSLAIEEQFYVLYPLVVVGGLRLLKGSSYRRPLTLGLLLVAAVASAARMAALYAASPATSRAYFGTDARAFELLLGAAAAVLIVAPERVRASRALNIVGLAAVAAVAVPMLVWDGTTTAYYRGGAFIWSIAAAAILVVVSAPGPLARVFSFPPLRVLGAISYGVYLWHWPVVTWITPDDLDGNLVRTAAVRTALTLALAGASFVLVEQPIRRRRALVAPRRAARVAMTVTAALAVGLAVLLPFAHTDAVPETVLARDVTAGTKAAPNLVLVSDSVGVFADPGFTEQVDKHGLAGLVNLSVRGCDGARGHLKQTHKGVAEDNATCISWDTRWPSVLQKAKPEVALVMLGAIATTPRLIDDKWVRPCDRSFDAWYREQVDQRVQILATHAKRVFVATTAPWFTSVVRGSSEQTELFRRFAGCLNDTYRAVARDQKATVIELGSFVCPNGECTMKENRDGVALRPDGLHYRNGADSYIANWLLDHMGY
jgi:peptidoglycan/LPS O-acetylase OafA/YrhL